MPAAFFSDHQSKGFDLEAWLSSRPQRQVRGSWCVYWRMETVVLSKMGLSLP